MLLLLTKTGPDIAHPDTLINMQLGQNPSRIVFACTDITDAHFKLILAYLQSKDETAMEGSGNKVKASAALNAPAFKSALITGASVSYSKNHTTSRCIEMDAARFCKSIAPDLEKQIDAINGEFLKKYCQLSAQYFAKKEKEKAQPAESKTVSQKTKTDGGTASSAHTASSATASSTPAALFSRENSSPPKRLVSNSAVTTAAPPQPNVTGNQLR